MSNIIQEAEQILISDKEIREMFGISQPTLWRWTEYKVFPKSVIRGKRSRRQVLDWAKKHNML